MTLKRLVQNSVVWVTVLTIPISILATIRSLHTYYNLHSRQYREALEYLETSACRDSGVRARLGEYNLCPQSEERVKIYPLIRAFYDLAEDLSWCGHGRCWAIVGMFTHSLPWLLVCSMIGALILFKCLSDKRYKDSIEHWKLPQNSGLLNVQ